MGTSTLGAASCRFFDMIAPSIEHFVVNGQELSMIGWARGKKHMARTRGPTKYALCTHIIHYIS
jgi:hypothetical protein